MNLTRYLWVDQLSGALANSRKLETLRLNDCGVTYVGCKTLASALTSNLSHLRELDLSGNKLEDVGLLYLSPGLINGCSKLGTLKLNNCGIIYAGCTSLASILTSNPSHLRELDLSRNCLDDFEMMMVSAGLKNNHKLEKLKLMSCSLTDEGCLALAQALRSNPSHMRELDLSENSLSYLDTMLLSSVLENPAWQLKTLRLVNCSLADESCAALMSALRSNPSHLRELDLSKNNLSYLDMMVLASAMELPYWMLETLKLNDCGITDDICGALASALRTNPSHLRELDLSRNKVANFGMQMLSLALEIPYCKLETLKLVNCDITDYSCLVSALRSNPSHLRNLDLSGNKLGNFGIQLICEIMENPCFMLETLKLNDCGLKDEDCVLLSFARVNSQNLRELDLSRNNLGDSGVKTLFAGPTTLLSKLGTFKLVNCGVTKKGCASLASDLISNPSRMKALDLSGNKIQDSGVKMLSDGLMNNCCHLEALRLVGCGVTDKGCADLASALISNPSHLRELDLSENKLSDSGIKLICAGLERPHCKLEMLRLNDCVVTDEGCSALASALTSNPSHLRELDLSENKLGNSGVISLSAGLAHCNVETLKLKHCGLTHEGCAALAFVMGSDHAHLKHVDLACNMIEDEGVQLLCAAFY